MSTVGAVVCKGGKSHSNTVGGWGSGNILCGRGFTGMSTVGAVTHSNDIVSMLVKHGRGQ